MKIETTRAQYEELKANPKPGYEATMECAYYVECGVQNGPPILVGKSRGRRSPNARIVVADRTRISRLSEHLDAPGEKAVEMLGDDWMASGTLGKALAAQLGANSDQGSKWVTSLLEKGVLGTIK